MGLELKGLGGWGLPLSLPSAITRPVYLALHLNRSGVLKINQEESENPSKINQNFLKNQSWRPLGEVLKHLNGQSEKQRRGLRFLEPSWGRLGGVFGRLGGLLGAVLAVLATSRAGLGLVLAAGIRAKINPKINQNFDAFGDRLFRGF